MKQKYFIIIHFGTNCNKMNYFDSEFVVNTHILCIDIWQEIINNLDLLDMIHVIMTCKEFYHKLYIKKIRNHPRMTTEILKQPKFSKAIQLDADNNSNITDVYFLKNLRYLSIRTKTGIDKDGLKQLDLYSLDMAYNPIKFDLSSLRNLRLLNIRGRECQIDQNDIEKMNLEELIVVDNPHINNISFMTKLRKLNAIGSGINQKGIEPIDTELDLKWLAMSDYMYSIKHLKNLKTLFVNRTIKEEDLNGLDLKEFYMMDNAEISNLNFMKNLKKLNADGMMCPINQKGIEELDLEEISIVYNKYIADVSFMKNIKRIHYSQYQHVKIDKSRKKEITTIVYKIE